MKGRGIGAWFGRLSLSKKFTLIIFAAVAVPMTVVSIFLSTYMYRIMLNDTLAREEASVEKTAPRIDETFEDIVRVSEGVQALNFARDIFRISNEKTAEELITSPESRYFTSRVNEAINGSNITAVRYYVDLEDFPFASGTLFRPYSAIRSSYWYGIMSSAHPSSLFCPPFYLSTKERENLGDCAYIVPEYIRNISGTVVRCYAVYYFSSDTLKGLLENNLTTDRSVSYIITDRENIAATTDARLSGIYFMNYRDVKDELYSTSGLIEKSILGEKVYLDCHILESSQWILVSVVPSTPIVKAARRNWGLFLAAWILIMGLSLGASLLMAHSLSKRITAVSSHMEKVKGTLPERMESDGSEDEIGQLIDSYNYLSDTINDFSRKQEESARELRNAEIGALQAQINPHFLYNTMEMISWMARQGREEEIVAVVADLSRFYRLTLSKGDGIGNLGDELEHISIYVRLQNMRFEDAVDLIVDVPEMFYDSPLPRLTLQPLVENSILHGIREKESHKGTIVITAWEEEGDVIMEIADDGVGMDEETVKGLLKEGSGKDEASGSHIAVYNTDRRLKISFGETYGLTYHSAPGEGTRVEVRLPMAPAE